MKIDECNRNFMSKVVKYQDQIIDYIITGKIAVLFDSHKSNYTIAFTYEDKKYEVEMDSSRSAGYFMTFDCVVNGEHKFEFGYVDH